jgi:quinol monooxygenase YgiN
MYILHVNIHVKPEHVEEFKNLSVENASASTVNEPGCARFDIVQQADDPTRFVYTEVYRDADSAAKHKETKHYNHWREVAEPLLAEPRTRVVYSNVFPKDLDY